jgi:type III secretion protein J
MWDIIVPPAKLTQALAILNQEGLPRIRGTNLLDLFGNPGIVPSDLQDRIRYQEGLAQQLASTIRKMDGVIDANVQVTVPRDEEGTQHLTASVYVRHRGVLDSSNNLLITKIKRYVANAIPGLSTDNVSVISDRATYADISVPGMNESRDEVRHYVSIWSIAIAQESVLRFRVIFYLFIFLLFLLASLLTFFLWKFYPLLRAMGSTREIFSPHQLTPTYFAQTNPSTEVRVDQENEENLL